MILPPKTSTDPIGIPPSESPNRASATAAAKNSSSIIFDSPDPRLAALTVAERVSPPQFRRRTPPPQLFPAAPILAPPPPTMIVTVPARTAIRDPIDSSPVATPLNLAPMIFRSSRLLRSAVLLRFAVLLLFAAARPAAADFYETPEFADAVLRTEEYVAQYGAGQVLLVLDIDNTLLASDTALGSDQWFDWQEYLLAQEPDSPQLVANDFPGLLNAQGLLFTLGSMHPPQADLPELIREVQATGVKTLVLTSRGDEFRTATSRELRKRL